MIPTTFITKTTSSMTYILFIAVCFYSIYFSSSSSFTSAFTASTNRANPVQKYQTRPVLSLQSTHCRLKKTSSSSSHSSTYSQLSYSNVLDPTGTRYDQNDLSIVTNDKKLESKQQLKVMPKPTTTTTIITLQDFYNVIQECRLHNQLLLVHWSAPWCRSCQRVVPLLQRTIQQIQNLSAQHHQQKQQEHNSCLPTNVRYINIPLLYSLSSSSSKTKLQQQSNHYDNNQNLHAMFDVTTVPYCHIYYPNIGLVHEFSITPNSNNPNSNTMKTKSSSSSSTRMNMKSTKNISELYQILESYIKGYCPVSYE